MIAGAAEPGTPAGFRRGILPRMDDRHIADILTWSADGRQDEMKMLYTIWGKI
jgi:hypothetical protein